MCCETYPIIICPHIYRVNIFLAGFSIMIVNCLEYSIATHELQVLQPGGRKFATVDI